MTVISIAGMHRSGTSMVARLLSLCGLYLGPAQEMVAASPDNPRGFWENARFLDLNDQILAAFGGAWDIETDLPDGWPQSGRLQRHREQAQSLIADFDRHGTWGWKDPRNSLTLPFWQQLIPDVKILVVLRNPLDIWRSLASRGHASLAFSNRLTQYYWQSLIAAAPPERLMICHYDTFFKAPKAELQRVLEFAGMSVSAQDAETAGAQIEQGLRHSQASLADLFRSATPRRLIESYLGLCREAGPNYAPVLAAELRESFPDGQPEADPSTWKEIGRSDRARPIKTKVDPALEDEIARLGDLVWRRDTQLSELTRTLKQESRAHAQEADSLRRQMADREAEIQRLAGEQERLKGDQQRLTRRLNMSEAQITEIQSGLAFRMIAGYRGFVERALPLSSRRRQLYSLVLKVPRVLFFESPGAIRRRLQAAWPHAKAASDRAAVPGGQSRAPQVSKASLGDGDRFGTQDRYAAAYEQLMSAARGPASDFVPVSSGAASSREYPIRPIAFYLPQYHPIPENDEWWGRGFTEWANVSKAIPQFVGHYQPRLPGELGFYDLRVTEVQRRQIELARLYGVYGFCMHYYWFNGKRLLETPLDQFVNMPGNDFPFCLCWANENWTRRWDGQENDVLIAQVHSEESDFAFIHDIAPYLRKDNYIRVDGRPVLIVYRVPLMPEPRATAERWRKYCRDNGIGDLYLIAAQTFGFVEDPGKFGFDAAVEFPPHNVHLTRINRGLQILNRDFAGSVFDYADVARHMTSMRPPKYQLFKTVFPGWDNEPRKPGRGHIFAFSSPDIYQDWLVKAGSAAMSAAHPDERLVFINAWNEWGEGAYLEPDRRYGYAYLQATLDALKTLQRDGATVSVAAQVPPEMPGRISQDPVVVYQMGKVGSRSVVFSLMKTYSELALPIQVYHVHNLNYLDEIEAVVRTRPNPAETLEAMQRDRVLRERIDRNKKQAWKVISLVREPVSRNIAWFFQNLHELLPDWESRLKRHELPLKLLQEMFLDTKQGTHDTAERWFDEQMLPVFGIDVFAEPFARERGYTVYAQGSRISLLVIRMEDLTSCASAAIQGFLGLDKFSLTDRNVADDKAYADLYRDFKKMPLPRSYVESMYDTRFVKHFYSAQEIENFARRWTSPAGSP